MKKEVARRMRKNASASKTRTTQSEQGKKAYVFNPYPASWYGIMWGMYLCYCYAAFIPTGPVWGIHFISYLPLGIKLLLLALGALLLLPKFQNVLFRECAKLAGDRKGKDRQKIRLLLPFIVAGFFFLLFHAFTIHTDIYGDEINMVKWYGDNTVFDWQWIGDVLSPHWVENKEALTITVHRIVAHIFSLPIDTTYHIVSELCGAIFVFLWLAFIQKISQGPLRLVLAVMGISAGALQVFFGHIENYSFGILTSTMFLLGLYFYIEGKLSTIIFILLYLLAFKAHIIASVLFPAFLMGIAYRYKERFQRLNALFSWNTLIKLIIVPTLLAGLLLYIFLFHSWNKPYAYVEGFQLSQSFLPVIPSPPPLDHYMLWSPYHLADFLNLLLMTSAPVVVILISLIIYHRKEILWDRPKIMIFTLAVIFPFIFFIAMNPQLTPLRDWDIYTLFFPPLLFFTAILITESGLHRHLPQWLSVSLLFGVLFTLPMIAVNTSPIPLTLRLHDAGAYIYRSYYAGSAYALSRTSVADSSVVVREHYTATVQSLTKDAVPGRDIELAGLTGSLATLFASNGNYPQALAWAESARKADTTASRATQYIAVYFLRNERINEASSVLDALLEHRKELKQVIDPDMPKLASIMSELSRRYMSIGNDSMAIKWSVSALNTDGRLASIYNVANYLNRAGKSLQVLQLLHHIPVDSLSRDVLVNMGLAANTAFGPDSGLPYLYKAKRLAPTDQSIDTIISELKYQSGKK